MTELLEELGAFLKALSEADLDEGAADAVTVGMVFQQQAANVYLPRILKALATPTSNIKDNPDD